jgi:hypothetical protein
LPAWFLKETSERAASAAAVKMTAADGTFLRVPAQWRIEMGRILLREHRRWALTRGRLEKAFEDLDMARSRIA